MPDLSGQTANEFVLGQHAAPAVPGTAPAEPIHMNPYNNAYLLPQNLVPSAPGEGQLFGIAPGQENADINGVEYLKRLYETYRAGGLEGGLLGQRELDSLNNPSRSSPGRHLGYCRHPKAGRKPRTRHTDVTGCSLFGPHMGRHERTAE